MGTVQYHLAKDRYFFDNKLLPKGFSQVDTKQDAPYFGQWANPNTLEFVSYTEGDVVERTFDNESDFVAFIRGCAAWGNSSGYGFKIDAVYSEAQCRRWAELGLRDILH